jgi:hypothetical protein
VKFTIPRPLQDEHEGLHEQLREEEVMYPAAVGRRGGAAASRQARAGVMPAATAPPSSLRLRPFG